MDKYPKHLLSTSNDSLLQYRQHVFNFETTPQLYGYFKACLSYVRLPQLTMALKYTRTEFKNNPLLRP